jgi:hypothetical protein
LQINFCVNISKAQSKQKAPTSTKTQPKRQKSAPSSPPQPAPQSQAEPADAPEQTIDPSDQGTSSAIILEQTTVTPSQGKILIMKSLVMNSIKKSSSLLVFN